MLQLSRDCLFPHRHDCMRVRRLGFCYTFIMVALCSRADHYIFILWFLLAFYLLFLHRLISAVAEWMSAIHGVTLVRI